MRVFIQNFTYIEKGVKYCGKNLLTQSVWKYDFQTSIHLKLFQHSLVPRSSWKIYRWISLRKTVLSNTWVNNYFSILGRWSDEIPRCMRRPCPQLTNLDPVINLIKSEPWSYGRAIFQCPKGYNIKGRSYITCNVNGTWSHQPPTCEGKVINTH